MKYARLLVSGEAPGEAVEFEQPIGKIVCVGRNYAEHARELNNPVPTTPVLFIKPSSAVVDLHQPLKLTRSESVHYEAELAVLIGETLVNADEAQAANAIAGLGLALDLTLRELQSELKSKGLPWETAKSFDGACPLSCFSPYQGQPLDSLKYQLRINDELRQDGQSANMLFPVPALLACISSFFTLEPGDVVLTGTPAGVGKLESGDLLSLSSNFGVSASTSIAP